MHRIRVSLRFWNARNYIFWWIYKGIVWLWHRRKRSKYVNLYLYTISIKYIFHIMNKMHINKWNCDAFDVADFINQSISRSKRLFRYINYIKVILNILRLKFYGKGFFTGNLSPTHFLPKHSIHDDDDDDDDTYRITYCA